MRQPQNAKRGRGRGRRGNGNNNNHHNHVPNRNTSYESNGPDVKLRGNAQQLHEKYMGLAHDAASAGERISAEAYTQFADHYFRLHQAAVGFAETKRQQDQAAAAVAASDQAFDATITGTAPDETSSATDDADAKDDADAPADAKPARGRGRGRSNEKTAASPDNAGDDAGDDAAKPTASAIETLSPAQLAEAVQDKAAAS
ncbi:DUF4167 domain-containing protein [Alphaproteobacteria bacterium]|nr:DUF4167 domain-containing protein [Alphaproteobacteria bacterium]MDC1120814.1 DUF4167 domain-containing protein [Alphaproteobacteria bacterium]